MDIADKEVNITDKSERIADKEVNIADKSEAIADKKRTSLIKINQSLIKK